MEGIGMLAERIGRVTADLEPGTSFYNEVVEGVRQRVEQAHTRDDLERIVTYLEAKMTPHLTDDELAPFNEAVRQLRDHSGPWSVEEFKKGFAIGTGERVPDDGQAAGRKLNSRQ